MQRSRRQHRDARGVLVGVRRGRRRPLGLGLVRRGRRPARGRRHRHRHGDPDGGASDRGCSARIPRSCRSTGTASASITGGRLGWCASHPVVASRTPRASRRAWASATARTPRCGCGTSSNELGGGNRLCYCAESSRAFRESSRARYGSIDALNHAWGTAVWGLRYRELRRRHRAARQRVGHRTRRCSSPSTASVRTSCSASTGASATPCAQRASRPITTNLMLTVGGSVADYADWVDDLDVVAIDHYPAGGRSAPRTRARLRRLSRAGSGSHDTVAAHGARGRSGELAAAQHPEGAGRDARHSIQHIAHGSDGALFFQWRASASGVEQFHSGMIPHAGSDTRQFREVVELGGSCRAHLRGRRTAWSSAPASRSSPTSPRSGRGRRAEAAPRLSDRALGAALARSALGARTRAPTSSRRTPTSPPTTC